MLFRSRLSHKYVKSVANPSWVDLKNGQKKLFILEDLMMKQQSNQDLCAQKDWDLSSFTPDPRID